MRRPLAAVALAVASFAIAPAAPAGPATCSDPCEVAAVAAGYVPPLVSIAAGGSVRWSSVDVSHPTADAGSSCFVVAVSSSVEPVPVRFDLTGGTVTAAPAGGSPSDCSTVALLPDGSAIVPYRCQLHPNMWGLIRVEPSGEADPSG